ncbi:MAG: hypothetical protein RLZZ401_486 [Pseudomonadota bacterium]|jgi:hypothetical protein
MAKRYQTGFSLLGLIFWGAIFGMLFVVGSQVAPTLIEYQAILKASKKAAQEGNSVAEVRAIFDRAGAIDNINSISGKDLDVTKEGDKIVAAFAYNRELHLAGPAYLLIKYSGRSK